MSAQLLQLAAGVDAVLLVLVGYALVRPRRRVAVQLVVDRGPVLAPASARQLALAHRLAARLLASSSRPRDEDFVVAAELWPGGRRVPYAARAWDLTLPLLGLEQLLEQLEALNARMAARFGRHGRG